MSDSLSPRIRSVNKVKPPYPINDFPKDFALRLCEQVVYLLATRESPTIEGNDWEQIFANCIGANWKPSNVGLDDVILGQCAWGAKTVKATSPSRQMKVRLISGRNSPVYSYGVSQVTDIPPDPLGAQILEIWNARVLAVRQSYKYARTVVLIRSNNLREFVVFEYETTPYDPNLYFWEWNTRGNLQGYLRATQEHVFTWQPHGSQFTIIKNVPEDHLNININRAPGYVKIEDVLDSVDFDLSWLEVHRGRR